ncbi:MAG: M48 family metalloprotease [Cyanobacteria bacterium]|nr:M48 family metalloprotease [Cyanobacteriota bacterium]MDW8201188.1 M48 family metalloprotease [Cyanobacteriota bacterium SKYGB_h_bin112]
MKSFISSTVMALVPLGALWPPGNISQASQAVQSQQANSQLPERMLLANAADDRFYQQAKKELREDWYVIYRIVDKMARANGLDESPWRIRIVPLDVFNATASELNVLTFYNGLLDQLHGDYDALACIIGHEMAHHTKNHIAFGEANLKTRRAQLQAEAEAAVVAEVNAAQEQQQNNAILGTILGGVFGTQSGTIGGTLNDIMRSSSADQQRQLQQRVQQIYAEKERQFLQEAIAQNHSQEYEADAVGYTYAVTAGFKPEGCQRAMNVMNRLSGSQSPSLTHPSTPDRMARLQALRQQTPPAALAQQGRAQLARSPRPLRYGISRDRVSLRVESRFGSQNIDDRLR